MESHLGRTAIVYSADPDQQGQARQTNGPAAGHHLPDGNVGPPGEEDSRPRRRSGEGPTANPAGRTHVVCTPPSGGETAQRRKTEDASSSCDAGDGTGGGLSEDVVRALAAIGLTRAHFRCFTDLFVGHRYEHIVKSTRGVSRARALAQVLDRAPRYRGRAKPGRQSATGGIARHVAAAAAGSWQLIRKRAVSDYDLVRHLAGEHLVGTGCRWDAERKRFRTRFFMLDFDWQGDAGDQRTRYFAAARAFGRPSLLFQSSGSRGWHAYWYLDRECDLFELRDPFGGGAVTRLLGAQGLFECNGRVEVYPRGHYPTLGPQNRHRLPFGRESVLLDPHTFEPVTWRGPQHDLHRVTDWAESGALLTVDTDDLLRDAAEVPPLPAGDGARRGAAPPHSFSLDLTEEPLDQIWSRGLTGPDQFNRTVFRLARDLWYRGGLDEDEATAALCRWIDDHHHDWSATFNRSELLAYEEIRAVVERVFRWRARSPRFGRRYDRPAAGWGSRVPGLSAWELRNMFDRTASDHAIALPEDGGEMQDRWWVHYYGVFLLRRAKEWVAERLRRPLSDVCRELPGARPSSGRFRGALAARVRDVWPDLGTPEFLVAIPDKLRASAIGLPKDSRYPLWRVLTRAGVFEPVRTSSKHARRAAVYRVRLDFHALSDNACPFFDLDEGVRALVSAPTAEAMYGGDWATRPRQIGASKSMGAKDAPMQAPETSIRAILRASARLRARAAA